MAIAKLEANGRTLSSRDEVLADEMMPPDDEHHRLSCVVLEHGWCDAYSSMST